MSGQCEFGEKFGIAGFKRGELVLEQGLLAVVGGREAFEMSGTGRELVQAFLQLFNPFLFILVPLPQVFDLALIIIDNLSPKSHLIGPVPFVHEIDFPLQHVYLPGMLFFHRLNDPHLVLNLKDVLGVLLL